MILIGIIFLLVVVPALWGLLMVIREVFVWQSDKGIARSLYKKLGRDIYEGGPLGTRVVDAFKVGFLNAVGWVFFLILLSLLLYSCFGDD